jgi:excisionase family DNA binding protein
MSTEMADVPMMTPEPFVTADEVADHLKIKRRQVLELARRNDVPAYPICLGKHRKMWRFKLSEVDQAIASRTRQAAVALESHSQKSAYNTISVGSPRSRKEKSNG